jgi:hypothetical protein
MVRILHGFSSSRHMADERALGLRNAKPGRTRRRGRPKAGAGPCFRTKIVMVEVWSGRGAEERSSRRNFLRRVSLAVGLDAGPSLSSVSHSELPFSMASPVLISVVWEPPSVLLDAEKSHQTPHTHQTPSQAQGTAIIPRWASPWSWPRWPPAVVS